jgi:hypothetical protein
MKSVLRLKGITIDGLGGVSSGSGAGPLLAPISLDPCNLPGGALKTTLAEPFIIPAWKPALSSLKDIADVIAVE